MAWTTERELHITLLMAAPSFQGGHSEVGDRMADALGTTFPLTMEKLKRVARRDGLDPDRLWPWLKELRRPSTTGKASP